MAADMNTAFVRALVATNLKAAVALRGAFIIQVVFMALNNLTFFVFWWVLMRRVPSLRGWHLDDIQLLFGIVAAAFGLTVTLAGGVRYLGRLIDEGDLDTLLTQPKSVLVHALGMRLQPSGFGDVLSGLIFIALSGQVSWRAVPVVLVAIIASALVFVACGIVFFSLAFSGTSRAWRGSCGICS
jgi:ABC-2 type transport system permease protein